MIQYQDSEVPGNHRKELDRQDAFLSVWKHHGVASVNFHKTLEAYLQVAVA